MGKMVSVAMMYLVLLEPYLGVKLSEISEPAYTAQKQDRNMRLPDGHLAKFYLFTPKRKSRSLDLTNDESFEDFDPSMNTKVIIHGFLDQVRIADWMHEMKDEFFKLGNFNVIIVDWSSGNSIPYSKAAANTEQVGEEISVLLKHLRDRFGARTESFHLIGHSLGSHVSGFAGERIKPLGRITGLDPAMYHFTNESPRRRLDPSDAIFVDVIHTDAGGIGMVKPVGHVDFYPNGGNLQPGCTATNYVTSLLERGVVESVRGLICSHMRAVMLFTESINSICQMRGIRCSSWKNYEDGKCDDCGQFGEKCAVMGYHTNMRRDYENYSYYLHTAANPPYCIYEYRLRIVDAENSPAMRLLPAWRERNLFRKKKFWITLIGNKGEVEFVVDERNEADENVYTVTSAKPLGEVGGALLKWKPKPLDKAVGVLSMVVRQKSALPLITQLEVIPISLERRVAKRSILCASPSSLDTASSIIGLRSIYC